MIILPEPLRGFLRTVVLAGAGLAMLGSATAAEPAGSPRPNVLWITCEDISPNLGCYGDSYALTPNLDRLATESLRYTRAFAAASVCTPARSCLITGVFASSLGTQHLRGAVPLPKQVRCFTEYLRQSGYYCSNNVKQDYNFSTPPGAWDESSRQAHWRKRKPGQPFFSVFNFTTTHQGQIRLAEKQFAQRTARLAPYQRHDPANAPLPPYYPDTPVVRRDVAKLYDLITAMDKQVGDLLGQLEEDGLAEETIVFFYSDHGTGLPRHKRWLYDSGIRVPLIIRFPEKYRHWTPGKPGTTVDRLVSFVDFAPTVLSLAGLEIPAYVQGRVFLGERAAGPRRYVFAVRDRVDEVYEFSRAVRDARYKYIRNYVPHRPRMQYSTYSEQTPTRQEFRRLLAEGKLEGSARDFMKQTKAPEELYDTQSDPHEIRNLADSADHREILRRMRRALRSWMVDTRDTGLLPEAEMHTRAAGGAPYVMARRTGIFPVSRILDAAELVGRGPTARAQQMALLAHPDDAVRYWAATGLAALGPQAGPAEDALKQALDDLDPSVGIAAAEALCGLGREGDALPVLVEGLQHDDPRVRLHAAIALVAIGQKARPAIPQLNNAMKDKGKGQHAVYTRWALAHVLKNLDRPANPLTQ